MKPFDEWTVLPHGPLVQLDDGLWTVTGQLRMPLTPLERRMTIVRLKTGKLVIFSAIAISEAQMNEIESWGEPAFLVVPGPHHRQDAKIWKLRYPKIQVCAPVHAREAVTEVVPVDSTNPDFEDDQVQFADVEGLDGYEAALTVRRPLGTTLIVNDVIGNMPSDAGIILRLFRFAGKEPRVPLPIKFGLKDKSLFRNQLHAWASIPGLVRIVMSHGRPIENDVVATLHKMAAEL